MSSKISELPSVVAANLLDVDVVPVVSSGVTNKVALTDLRAKIGVAVPAGRTSTSQQYTDNNAVFNVKDYGAVADATTAGVGTDNTAFFQAAIDAAFAAGKSSVLVPDGRYSILGTINHKIGVTLYGNSGVGQYYDGFVMAYGALLIKPSTGTVGPIISMEWASGLHHVSFKHLKVNGGTTGVLRMGAVGTAVDITNCKISDISIIGVRTGNLTGAQTCYGIYFPESAIGHARYFNHFNNIHITDCDIAGHLGGQSNGNNFICITIRECHIHWDLDGQASAFCIENNFFAVGHFAINVLVPAPIVFRLRNGSVRNNFIGYNTETFGSLYDIDATSIANNFLGNSNEVTNSYAGSATAPDSNNEMQFAPAVNIRRNTQMYLPISTGANRNVFGAGNKMSFLKNVTGAMPQTGRAAGTLAAADANCKSIIQFPGLYTKSSLISMRCHLIIYAFLSPVGGMCMIEVDFWYRNRNTSTSAGEIDVIRVTNNSGTLVTGLWFLTGVAGATPFAIAIVGGNNGATPFDQISFELDVTALDYSSSNALNMAALASIAHVSTAITANDVTNGISLLTVANTAV